MDKLERKITWKNAKNNIEYRGNRRIKRGKSKRAKKIYRWN